MHACSCLNIHDSLTACVDAAEASTEHTHIRWTDGYKGDTETRIHNTCIMQCTTNQAIQTIDSLDVSSLAVQSTGSPRQWRKVVPVRPKVSGKDSYSRRNRTYSLKNSSTPKCANRRKQLFFIVYFYIIKLQHLFSQPLRAASICRIFSKLIRRQMTNHVACRRLLLIETHHNAMTSSFED